MTLDTCIRCKNYRGDLSCLAFEKIPKEILNGENDHSETIKGQTTWHVFEPINK